MVSIISVLKSFYASIHLFAFPTALRLPIRVSRYVKLKNLSGSIIMNGTSFPAMRVGFDEIDIYDRKKDSCVLSVSGTIILDGTASFGVGSKISVASGAVLRIGDNFVNTAAVRIICHDSISIGRNALVSWDTTLMDCDFHQIKYENDLEYRPVKLPICIGDNVWIGFGCTILKGSSIADGCILGASSLINCSFSESACLIAGIPAHIVKHNVIWSK